MLEIKTVTNRRPLRCFTFIDFSPSTASKTRSRQRWLSSISLGLMQAVCLGTLRAVLLSASLASAKELRLRSPDGRFCAVYHYSNAEASLVESISFSDSAGHMLFSDDYGTRDYRPEKGRWTRSSRFFVYTLSSRGGHSPWHRPFIVADTKTRRCTPEGDIGQGDCISDFQLSGRDTIAYNVLDRSKDNWDAGIPSIPVGFSLSSKFPPK